VTTETQGYAARLRIDYPEKLDRVTTFFRILWALPVVILLSILTAGATSSVKTVTESGRVISEVSNTSGGIAGALFAATLLMILIRRRYPRWWFDFALELNRFSTRVGAYLLLLTDGYPSTVEEQSVHLDLDYPDVERDLNRWLPLIKWLLALPHLIILVFLYVAVVLVTVIAWFAILFTGRYPRGMFDFVVGVARWSLRVYAYAFLLLTDEYPPFALA
jgi:hypothetical protein